jgi:hypothetical protein
MDTHRSRRQRRSNQETQRSPLFPVPAVGPSLPQGPMVALPSFMESPCSPAGAFVWARVGRAIPNQNSCCGHAESMARPYLPTRWRTRLPLSGPRRPRPNCETPWRASPSRPRPWPTSPSSREAPASPRRGLRFAQPYPKFMHRPCPLHERWLPHTRRRSGHPSGRPPPGRNGAHHAATAKTRHSLSSLLEQALASPAGVCVFPGRRFPSLDMVPNTTTISP